MAAPTPPGRAAASANRAHRGLTIIELMVVVAVVAVLITLAAPSMRAMIAAQRVKSINAELVTDLQFARSEAARRNRNVFVRFNPADGCYVIYVDAISGSCDCSRATVCTAETGREEIKTVRLPPANGVSLSTSSASSTILRFGAQSGRQQDNSFQVGVDSTLGGQLRTTINAAGRPTVCTPDGSVSGTPTCP